MPPLAASAQTWKPKTANMNTLATIAAAAGAHFGSALLVFSIQQLELEHGSHHFALQEDVAARVSGGESRQNSSFFHRCCHLAEPPWQLPTQP